MADEPQMKPPSPEPAPIDFSTIRLDRSRDFGTVCGEGTHGAAYAQDGLHFDAHEQIITEDDWLFPPAKRKELEAKIRARQLREQMERDYRQKAKELGIEALEGDVAADSAEAEAEANKAFDLKAWAQGRLKTQFFVVKEAAKTQYGINGTTAAAIAVALVEAGVIAASDVKIKV